MIYFVLMFSGICALNTGSNLLNQDPMKSGSLTVFIASMVIFVASLVLVGIKETYEDD